VRVQLTTTKEYKYDAKSAVVFPLVEGKAPASKILSKSQLSAVAALKKQKAISGKGEEVYLLPTPGGSVAAIVIIGLGKASELTPETLRRCGGHAAKALIQNKLSAIAIDAATGEIEVEAFLEGLVLGQYSFDVYKKESGKGANGVTSVKVVANGGAKGKALLQRCRQALSACDGANFARDLAHTASNDLTPTALAKKAQGIAKEIGAKCHILREKKLKELGMGLLVGVGQGSDEPSTLSIIHYTHPKAKKTVALVGKGITFDTGGISIKPSRGMEDMKYDMCGAAAVLGAMKAIGKAKPAVNVVCVVPSAENMPSASAVTPGEILRAYDGTTVEVHNTDAEGRLILADALAYTVKRFKPDAIADAATLTGAAIVALGHYAAPIISSDDGLTKSLSEAACQSGERIWPLPLWDDYLALMDGTHADLTNTGPPMEAGTIMGAAFLKRFVGDTPWAHLDIAGTAWGPKSISYYDTKYATGFGARLLAQWVVNVAAK
jgi:leucyl aminopeptidase